MKTEHGIIGIMCALFWAPRLSGRFITNEHGECSCQYELSGIIMNFGNSPPHGASAVHSAPTFTAAGTLY